MRKISDIKRFFEKQLTFLSLHGRINTLLNVLVAQLDRVTGYEPVGRGFESLQAHQLISRSF